MSRPLIDPRAIEAQEKLTVLDRARAIQEMMQTLGWHELMSLREQWRQKFRDELQHQPTDNREAATDALRRWQIAEEWFGIEAQWIESTLDTAREITGSLHLEEALYMEQIREQSQSSGPAGIPADPTGH